MPLVNSESWECLSGQFLPVFLLPSWMSRPSEVLMPPSCDTTLGNAPCLYPWHACTRNALVLCCLEIWHPDVNCLTFSAAFTDLLFFLPAGQNHLCPVWLVDGILWQPPRSLMPSCSELHVRFWVLWATHSELTAQTSQRHPQTYTVNNSCGCTWLPCVHLHQLTQNTLGRNKLLFRFVIAVVQSLSHVQLLATPWTVAQVPLSSTISQSLLRFISMESVMASGHLFLYCPLSPCCQSFLASGSFPMSQLFASGGQGVGASASASVLPMNTQDWFPLDWLDLLAVQGILKSLFQHHSSKASILWHSAFFYFRFVCPRLNPALL